MALISYDKAVIATQKPEEPVILPETRIRGDTYDKKAESSAAVDAPDYQESTTLSLEQDIGGSSSGNQTESEETEVVANDEEETVSVVTSERRTPILTDEAEAKLQAEEQMVLPVRQPVKPKKPKATKAKPVAKAKKASRASDSDTIQLQHFSREAMDYVRREIGDSKRREHALEAYLYIKSGGGFSVSDEVMTLVQAYDGDKSIANMDARIARMEVKMNSLLNILYELELSLSYILLDRAGLGGRVPNTIKEIDLAGHASLETREHLRVSARDQQKRDGYSNGRPIR